VGRDRKPANHGAHRNRDAYWEAHPDELTQQQRMDFFRRGVGDARKAGVFVK